MGFAPIPTLVCLKIGYTVEYHPFSHSNCSLTCGLVPHANNKLASESYLYLFAGHILCQTHVTHITYVACATYVRYTCQCWLVLVQFNLPYVHVPHISYGGFLT